MEEVTGATSKWLLTRSSRQEPRVQLEVGDCGTVVSVRLTNSGTKSEAWPCIAGDTNSRPLPFQPPTVWLAVAPFLLASPSFPDRTSQFIAFLNQALISTLSPFLGARNVVSVTEFAVSQMSHALPLQLSLYLVPENITLQSLEGWIGATGSNKASTPRDEIARLSNEAPVHLDEQTVLECSDSGGPNVGKFIGPNTGRYLISNRSMSKHRVRRSGNHRHLRLVRWIRWPTRR
jgi:hypothetical protein